MIENEISSRLTVGDRVIAVRTVPGRAPGVLWLGGFKSDMTGTKAEHLARWAAARGTGYVRFDYSGHGASSGRFEDGTISHWLAESLAVFEATSGPQVLVGSSMGGWMALLLARALAARGEPRLAALVLIAPAPDFTQTLMWERFPPPVRQQIETTGRFLKPSLYGEEAYVITRALIEDGRRHLLLGAPFAVGCPVRILQGAKDEDVPWEHAMRLVSCLAEDDVVFALVKDGDHRLSRPEDLERLTAALEEFV
ncbi:alpha/beta hydrolase [Xanthobacter tagetidis]|jgi:pimeloyl-ACP methyl ester carboxylesterase|uniref:Palmitoyl-protein thioesterase ABHD10, mitochondrial n=1 Tax=Xanthobacter tagetidis TaxID=60216 RepID=A0A3L7AFF8_9HYPH|nr:alpha/beta hydrolase [Xanthobacter tagetidis]MBB6306537.1 pimeloyl-ACP methyl ester carboxylesterase [Xanthobacter tagetidis]RLP79129.1 alpha/beta hydrolase [Xanthobacter tagetidis]